MRITAIMLLLLALLPIGGYAHAAAADGSFDVGVWRGAPVTADGTFTSCSMVGLFGTRTAPVVLTVALDRARGWALSVGSDRLELPAGPVAAGLAFDDGKPADAEGRAASPVLLALQVPTTGLLDRHLDARKLTVIAGDVALPFALPRFAEATRALRQCVQANAGGVAAAEPPAPPLPVSFEGPRVRAAGSRHFAALVEPAFIGFVGSVTIVLAFVVAASAVGRARMRMRYLALWSAEYRAAAPRHIALREPRAAGLATAFGILD